MSLYGYNLVYNCTKSSHEIGFDSVLSVGTVPKSSRKNVESGKYTIFFCLCILTILYIIASNCPTKLNLTPS